jgi:hypothetical protein
MRPQPLRIGEHPLGEIDADDLGGPGLGKVERQLPGAAAKVQDAGTADRGQEAEKRRMLVCAAEGLVVSLEPRVASKNSGSS